MRFRIVRIGEENGSRWIQIWKLMVYSHFVTIPPGARLMSDVLLMSPILRDPSEAGASGGEEAAGGGGGGFEFGFDPSLDPELALVRVILS